MLNLHPQFITQNGKKMVVLSAKEYEDILEELEELRDVRVFDEVKKSKEDFIPMEEAFKIIEAKRNQK